MPKITNFREANALLLQYVPPAKKYHAAVVSLEKMTALMAALGNPQDSYKTIHVAGTSGKTSTSYYITSFLFQAGKKVGLTVSPHVDEVNERVQINLTPLVENEFCNQLNTFMEVIEKLPITPSYFELLVAFAYWQFAQSQVDYAVIEVGMGGKLDATNVISRADKVCVITDIGLDHTEYLGDTLEKVAGEKAGIICDRNQVLMYQQDVSVMKVAADAVAAHHAELQIITEPPMEQLPHALPLFQRRNWYLAQHVYEYIGNRDSLIELDETNLQNVITTYIPARMEIVKHGNKTVIIDGSHNAQKLHALIGSIKERFPNQPVATLVSFGKGDDSRMQGGMDELMQLTSRIIATTFNAGKDAPKSPVDPDIVVAYAAKHGSSASAIADPTEAFEHLLSYEEPILLVTGSFFLLNHIRPLVNLKGN